MRGQLKLRAERDARGCTVLTQRHTAGAFHLSKPYWDGRTLLVQWVNPTAGIFAGDRLESSLQVGPGASLLVTTPSATRIHARPAGELLRGEQSQILNVAREAWLELGGEWLIPQQASAFRQRTEISLERGAGLFYTELLAPGRVAHGEILQFAELDLGLRLWSEGKLILQERLHALPDRLWMLQTHDEQPLFTATCLIALPSLSAAVFSSIRSLLAEHPSCGGGFTQLDSKLLAGRLVATRSLTLKRTLEALRSQLEPHHSSLQSRSRKL